MTIIWSGRLIEVTIMADQVIASNPLFRQTSSTKHANMWQLIKRKSLGGRYKRARKQRTYLGMGLRSRRQDSSGVSKFRWKRIDVVRRSPISAKPSWWEGPSTAVRLQYSLFGLKSLCIARVLTFSTFLKCSSAQELLSRGSWNSWSEQPKNRRLIPCWKGALETSSYSDFRESHPFVDKGRECNMRNFGFDSPLEAMPWKL